MRAMGPHRIGVARVMARAGLTHGGFYAHFKSKDALVAATVGRMFEEALATFERITAGKAPAFAVRDYVEFYLSKRHRNAIDLGCPLPPLLSDLPRLGPAPRASFEAGLDRLIASFGAFLSALGHGDARTLAASAFTEMVGALSIARALGPGGPSDAVLRHSRERVLARLAVGEPGMCR